MNVRTISIPKEASLGKKSGKAGFLPHFTFSSSSATCFYILEKVKYTSRTGTGLNMDFNINADMIVIPQ